MIRKKACTHKNVMEELKRSIDGSKITKEDEELEIVIGDEHICFTTSKTGPLIDVNQSKEFLKCTLLTLNSIHFNTFSLFHC
ncbi:unnamed protein product [Nyctereutes procyonoides]|uniref:(raccoon dog) hypothetical protein n=1 Tax=Nyctereutes procyonoides TaxID=34880 RepID=A0A811YIW7_NYCPR|nr:unnamed protein product [Nyctereutes procyonoides]